MEQTQAQTVAATANFATQATANLKADTSVVKGRVFHSTIPSIRYVFRAGKHAVFIDGKYTTNIAHEIEELDAEIEAGHPNFFIKSKEEVAPVEPLEALREKFIKEFLAKQAEDTKTVKDGGTSEQGKLNVANSTTIASAAAGSDSSLGNSNNAPAVGSIKIGAPK